MSDFDLTGKVCVVTGAGRGIGRGMAEGLARHGATVVLSGRTQTTLEETAAAIGDKRRGGQPRTSRRKPTFWRCATQRWRSADGSTCW